MTAKHTRGISALMLDNSFDGSIRENEPLNIHTSYNIGGPARYFVRVDSIGALRALINACEESLTSWMMLGRGSNVLVSDEGFDGAAVILGRDFKTCRFDEETHHCFVGAAVALSSVVQEAFHKSLAGMEFAVGTPGSIGGALRMNAGTRDTWIGEQVVCVTSYSPRFGFRKRNGSELTWDYRKTSFEEDEVILECELALSPADPFFIRGKMEALLAKRRKSQPLTLPSCGSVFVSPKGYSAGEMIEKVGLKGTQIGGAQISETHANFIVNVGNASANDVRALIKLVKEKVFEEYGIQLQTEVKFVGFAN